MSSHGVSLCWPAKDFSGSSRDSIGVPSAVMITFLRQSGLPLTYQMAPVMDAAAWIVFTSFQRARPPCAFTANSNRSPMDNSLFWFRVFVVAETQAAWSLAAGAARAASKSLKRRATFGYYCGNECTEGTAHG